MSVAVQAEAVAEAPLRTVSGYYSTDGSTWTKVGPTVNLAGIAETQDAGLIATSHAAGVTGLYSLGDFPVTP